MNLKNLYIAGFALAILCAGFSLYSVNQAEKLRAEFYMQLFSGEERMSDSESDALMDQGHDVTTTAG